MWMDRLDALDHWCLWRLLGIKWYQFVSNAEVWQTSAQPLLISTIQARHLSLFGLGMFSIFFISGRVHSPNDLCRRRSRMEWSTVSNAADRYPLLTGKGSGRVLCPFPRIFFFNFGPHCGCRWGMHPPHPPLDPPLDPNPYVGLPLRTPDCSLVFFLVFPLTF